MDVSNYNKVARITGFLLLAVTITHMIGFQISNGFVISGNFAGTAANVAAGEDLYRMALLSYTVSSILSVPLAAGFYLLLEPISRFSAMTVLASRLFEACIASASWAIRFAVVDNQTKTNLLGPEGSEAFHRAMRAISNAAFDISAIGLALAILVGFGVFFRAKTIPRILSAIAIFGAIVVLGSSIATLAMPKVDIPSHLAFAITLLSQLAIGSWMLVFGGKSAAKANFGQ